MNEKQKWILGAVALVLLLVIAGFGYQELQKEAERQEKSQAGEQIQMEEQAQTEEQIQTEEQTGTEETKENGTASQEEEKEATEYAEAPDPEMANWAYMALMESRIVLESDLSDEKQILISTGMGGKGEKLRFYVLILANELKPFQDYQRKIVEREFPYQLEKADCEIEQLTIGEQYVAMVFLIPVLAEIKQVIERVINECNEYGNFLSSSFTITNVKELSEEEVHEVIKKNERDSRTGR